MPQGGLKTSRPKTVARRAPPKHSAAGKNGSSESPDLLQLIAPITPHLQQVEQSLVEQVSGFDNGVREYVRYTLGGQGKRLRPVLALFSGGACGKIERGHVDLGVIVELIHLATLVHDDVIDEATVRRSKPTANSRWGNEIPVLVGDCLFAHALELAASYPTTEVCRKISAATNTVCAGEILQTRERFNLALGLNEYLRIVEMKTAALFAVSCELGAYLSGANGATIKALRAYGLSLGIAYQIYDDCVDIFGDEPAAGKSLGTDLVTGKLTLPLLLFLRDADATQRQRANAWLTRNGEDHRKELAAILAEQGALRASLQLIDSYIEKSRAALATLPRSEASESLVGLTEFLSRQSRRVGG